MVLLPPDIRESLTERLDELGRARKRVALAAGVFAFIATVVGCVAVACFLDAWQDLPALWRAVALTVTLTVGGVLWLRGISRSLALKTDPRSVAHALEEQHPTLNDVLASAVCFLEAGDAEPRGVSSRLQNSTVKAARRQADRHDFEKIIPTAACWKAGWACAAVLAIVLPLALVNTTRASTALSRLADPFAPTSWPKKTRIEVITPETFPLRITVGEPLQLRFAVRGLIPDHAVLTIRYSSGDVSSSNYPLTLGNDSRYPHAAVINATLDATKTTGPFTLRIEANDADTGELAVDVVPAPSLVPRGGRPTPQFLVIPPRYTGLPSFTVSGSGSPGGSKFEFPVGSAVQLRAATDIPLAAASLVYLGDVSGVERVAGLAMVGNTNPLAAFGAQSLADLISAPIPVELSEGGRVLSASFAPTLSGFYALRMTDHTGLSGTHPLTITVLADPAPAVALVRPAADIDPLFTANASIPVDLTADDKLYGLRRVFLEYRVGRDGRLQVIPLSDTQEVSRALPAIIGGYGSVVRNRTFTKPVTLTVPVSEFKRDDGTPVRDGDTLIIQGAADDWDDVTPVKAPGRSGEVEIRIASVEAIEAWLQRELAGLRRDLRPARDEQRAARQKTLDARAKADGTLESNDRNQLLAAEQVQRQVVGRIASEGDGLWARAEVLREIAVLNNLPPSKTTSLVEAVADELKGITERELPVIVPSLLNARELGTPPARRGQERVVPDLLIRAARHQKAVEDGLTSLIDLLAIWGGAAEIRGEARELRDQVLRQAAEVEKLDPKSSVADLERSGNRADHAAERAGQLLDRATRFAVEKAKQATDARVDAAKKEAEAADLAAKAAKLPMGTPQKSALNAQAITLRAEATDLKAIADKAAAEAAALNKGVRDAGGNLLPEELRAAAAAARKSRPFDAARLLNSAANRLGQLADALDEKPDEAAPDLEKMRKGANDLDDLAAAQNDLRNRAVEAAKITDPARREAALKALAAEQEKLIERGRQLVQRLTRDRADSAAREARLALERMEAARGDLENGSPGTRPQDEAVERLDNARDQLDAAAAVPPERLTDETRRKLADKVNALLERQKAALTEADRIHGLLRGAKKWERDQQTAYVDLAETREEAIAKEVRALAEKEFAPLPVMVRLLTEAAGAMESAADRMRGRLREFDPELAFDPDLETANDRKVKRPMELATRRLGQLLDALKADDPRPKGGNPPKKDTPPPKSGNPPTMPPSGGANADVVPPLAQLKVLRALQAELNQQTAEFAKTHPDPAKLTEEEREELKELEKAQRDIAALFEQLAKLFEEHEPKGQPEEPKQEKQP